ncbi:mCG66128 [Mus musculus]|nr:mCG66128 [Mus musculus]
MNGYLLESHHREGGQHERKLSCPGCWPSCRVLRSETEVSKYRKFVYVEHTG